MGLMKTLSIFGTVDLKKVVRQDAVCMMQKKDLKKSCRGSRCLHSIQALLAQQCGHDWTFTWKQTKILI